MKKFRAEIAWDLLPAELPTVLHAIENVLAATQDREFRYQDGICILVTAALRRDCDVFVDFGGATTEAGTNGELDDYEFYSGNPCYPVAVPNFTGSADQIRQYAKTYYWASHRDKGKWKGEYGERRRVLAAYFAKEIRAWIEEIEAEEEPITAAMPG